MNRDKLIKLQSDGYTHLTSIVKTCYNTTYYNVVSIDRILANNCKWIRCARGAGKYKKGIGVTRNSFKHLKTAPRSRGF
jgi:hypothetical protein